MKLHFFGASFHFYPIEFAIIFDVNRCDCILSVVKNTTIRLTQEEQNEEIAKNDMKQKLECYVIVWRTNRNASGISELQTPFSMLHSQNYCTKIEVNAIANFIYFFS